MSFGGLLAAVGGKKVLQIDRNQQYGGDCGSLNLEEMCKRHNVSACVGWTSFCRGCALMSSFFMGVLHHTQLLLPELSSVCRRFGY